MIADLYVYLAQLNNPDNDSKAIELLRPILECDIITEHTAGQNRQALAELRAIGEDRIADLVKKHFQV